MENELIIIKTTFAKKSKAVKLAKILLNQKLAACVQFSKIESSYVWNQKITNTKEILVAIKTKASLYNEIERVILQNHEYETPQILAIKIQGAFLGYENWVLDAVKQ